MHGYLLTGDISTAHQKALSMAAEILNEDTGKLNSHPDFSIYETASLSVNDAREIRDKASRSSFKGQGRIFIIKTDFYTKEAANALLKTLEESSGKNYFFLITSSPENVLDTLRSRLALLKFDKSKKYTPAQKDFIDNFLKAEANKRIEMTKKIVEDKEKSLHFLDALECHFRNKLVAEFSGETINILDDILKNRNFIRQRAGSSKMVVEYLCLVL